MHIVPHVKRLFLSFDLRSAWTGDREFYFDQNDDFAFDVVS